MADQKFRRIPNQQQQGRPHYTQVNILFPADHVELPSADKFRAFPPEAQKAILVGFEREQIERHGWLKTQQANEHAYNMQVSRHFLYWKMGGLIGGVVLALGIFATGAWLVSTGASTVGTATMIVAVAGLVGTAIYGHKARSADVARSEEPDGS